MGLTPTKHMTQELNKYIATEIMGLRCWHEWGDPICSGFKVKLTCSNCGQKKYRSNISRNPDYCSSLDLIHAVELKVIEKVGQEAYENALTDIMLVDSEFEPIFEITATALQRARACEKAHKLAMEGK